MSYMYKQGTEEKNLTLFTNEERQFRLTHKKAIWPNLTKLDRVTNNLMINLSFTVIYDISL